MLRYSVFYVKHFFKYQLYNAVYLIKISLNLIVFKKRMRIIYTEIKYVQSHKQAQHMISDMIFKVPHNKCSKGIIIIRRYFK